MGILTVAEIKTEVKSNIGNRDDADSRLTPLINLSLLRIARKHEFDSLRQINTVQNTITTSAATDKFLPLPTATGLRIRKIYGITVPEGTNNITPRKLRKVLVKHWDATIPEPEFYDRGDPTHYAKWDNTQIELWRVPDEVFDFTFRIMRWPTDVAVTGDGQPVDIDDVDDLVINLTSSYLHQSFGRSEKAREFFTIYRAQLKDAFDEDDEDFDMVMAGVTRDRFTVSKGIDDPFVRSTTHAGID